MHLILAGIDGVICYIHNIAIAGKPLSECVQRTMLVLTRLDKHNVRLRLDEFEWFVTEFEYLGYILNAEGRTPTPSLHPDILEAPAPTCTLSAIILRSDRILFEVYPRFQYGS